MLVCPYVMRRDFLHNQGDFATNEKSMPLFSVRRIEIWARDQMLIEKEALCCLLLIKPLPDCHRNPTRGHGSVYFLPKNNV